MSEYVVYVAQYEGIVMYVGEGKSGREAHITSGVSHVYEANRFHFQGKHVEVRVEHEIGTKSEAVLLEKKLIDKYKPLWNRIDKSYVAHRSRKVYYKNLSKVVDAGMLTNTGQISLVKYVISKVREDGACNISKQELLDRGICKGAHKILSYIEEDSLNKYTPKKLIKIVKSRKIAHGEYMVYLTKDFMEGTL